MGEEKEKKKTVKELLKEWEDNEKKIGETKIISVRKGNILENFYTDLVEALIDDGWEIVKHFEKITVTPMSAGGGAIAQRVASAQDRVITLGKTIGELTRTAFMMFNDIMKMEQLAMLIDQYKNSKDERTRSSALKKLKEYWTTKVDMVESGPGSINQLAVRYGMAMLRDAFFAIDSIEEAEKLHINDRIKRILIIKMRSFYNWLELSMEDVPRRLNFMRKYLRQHLNYIKTYIEWLKPYLRVTKALRFFRPERPDIFELLDQTFVTSGFFAFRKAKGKDDKEFLVCAYLVIDEISKVRGVKVPPAGETLARYGKLEVTLKVFAVGEKEKEDLKEAIKNEESLMIEEELGSSVVEMIKEMEEYLENIEKKTKEYYKKILGKEEEEKKEEKKKGLKERLKEETEFIGAILSLIEKFKKKEEKTEKKEEEKKEELKVTKGIKKAALEIFIKLKISIKKMLGGLYIEDEI